MFNDVTGVGKVSVLANASGRPISLVPMYGSGREEREIIVTYVSTSGLQKQSNKAEKGQMNSQIIETSY